MYNQRETHYAQSSPSTHIFKFLCSFVVHFDALVVRDLLFLGQLLRVLDDERLELLLVGSLQEFLPEVHVGEDGGEGAARLQGVLGPFLLG